MASKLEQLNSEQLEVLNKVVKDEKSIFFTGSAGTGKSFVLKIIINTLREKYKDPEAVAVTASTGIAAFNIGGSTLHSFAAVGLAEGTKEDLCKKVQFNKTANHRWRYTKVLIIDEISMISAELFDKLSYIGSEIRKNEKPFGGIQLVLVGDLLQLPPVNTTSERMPRVFESEQWKKCITEYIKLTKVFRQDDMEFIKTLACIRVGAVPRDVIAFMEKLETKKEFEDDDGVVELFGTKKKTNIFNATKLESLNEELRTYVAHDTYSTNRVKSGLFDSCQAPAELELKVGAQVMLVKNLNRDLVNGTVGIVTKFTEQLTVSEPMSGQQSVVESVPVVKFKLANGKTFKRPMKRESWDSVTSSGVIQGTRKQIPLILAWGLTIHKSQSQTIQRLRVDIGDVFESGQIYTALSRAVSPDTLEVTGFSADKVKVDQVSLKFCLDNKLL